MIPLSEITDEQVIAAIRAVAAENPDKVYALPDHMEPMYEGACNYVHTAPDDEAKLSPGCLIGSALHRLGVPLETLAKVEGSAAGSAIAELLPQITVGTRVYANNVQMWQDDGRTWGQAVALNERN